MSVNKVILVGNVGKDPDVRYVETGVCVANFPLATSDRAYTTRSGTQVPERTEWHNIGLGRGLAEGAEKYVRKGTQLYIEGKIRTRSWVDATTNQTRYITEIYADNMEILGRRQDGSQSVSAVSSASSAPQVEESSSADDLPF